jgi:hypothetical protein
MKRKRGQSLDPHEYLFISFSRRGLYFPSPQFNILLLSFYIKGFKVFHYKSLIISTLFAFFCGQLFSQNLKETVPPGKEKIPNYNFSLDSLKIFFPNNKLDDIEKKSGKGLLVKKNGGFIIKKYFVSHIRYKFPVFVQYENNRSLDFFARLPTYFLHDIFHQSLINRYGPQNQFLNLENSSLYVWQNINGLKLVYNGSCTITCFPQYLFGSKAIPPKTELYKTILDQLWKPFPEEENKNKK